MVYPSPIKHAEVTSTGTFVINNHLLCIQCFRCGKKEEQPREGDFSRKSYASLMQKGWVFFHNQVNIVKYGFEPEPANSACCPDCVHSKMATSFAGSIKYKYRAYGSTVVEGYTRSEVLENALDILKKTSNAMHGYSSIGSISLELDVWAEDDDAAKVRYKTLIKGVYENVCNLCIKRVDCTSIVMYNEFEDPKGYGIVIPYPF